MEKKVEEQKNRIQEEIARVATFKRKFSHLITMLILDSIKSMPKEGGIFMDLKGLKEIYKSMESMVETHFNINLEAMIKEKTKELEAPKEGKDKEEGSKEYWEERPKKEDGNESDDDDLNNSPSGPSSGTKRMGGEDKKRDKVEDQPPRQEHPSKG